MQKVNDQLNESNVALEKALKAKSEFLATTSHEIRTPLNGILGMTQVMLLDGRMDPDVRERVQLVHGAGESMRAIVDDILDVAKMENGGLTVGAEPFNPKAALEDVCRLWSANAEAKGLTFALDVSQCPSRLIGDEQRLRQVVFNLLSNAVKFTDAGHIALNGRAEADHFVLDVSDTGMGIPESEFDAIFTAFHQVDGATTRKHGGTGLGLSICRNLSRAMGGDVTVRSETGRGSTFTLRLPLPEAGEHVATAANDAGPNVVAVEPNPMNGCLLEAFCAQAGYALHLFASTDEAVARLSGNTAELVFLAGSALPNGPGEAMAALMAVREAAPGARLVVLLESGAPIEGPAARLCGADEVLNGPFEAEAVLAPILAKAA